MTDIPKSKGLKNVDYSKACIYAIISKNPLNKLAYVGSTCNFKQRKYEHKSYCNKPTHHSYNYPLYQDIRDSGGWHMFEMMKIEDYPCNNVQEKIARERYWYESLSFDFVMLNHNIPNRTKEEYYRDSREIKRILREMKNNL